ncbi:hypothetical protein HanRHA438_Chr00c05g0845331 [Helianthus annuus]|nr:hypothetical protein HanRHA438_Chr00c05g0845331 [Helianthus annuus]
MLRRRFYSSTHKTPPEHHLPIRLPTKKNNRIVLVRSRLKRGKTVRPVEIESMLSTSSGENSSSPITNENSNSSSS